MQLNNDQWVKQTSQILLNPIAILRLLGAAMLWQTIGLILAFIFNFGIFIVFIVLFFAILWLFPYWQLAYTIIYRISGNKEVSPYLESHILNWWNYISLVIRIAFLSYLFYFGLKLLFQ